MGFHFSPPLWADQRQEPYRLDREAGGPYANRRQPRTMTCNEPILHQQPVLVQRQVPIRTLETNPQKEPLPWPSKAFAATRAIAMATGVLQDEGLNTRREPVPSSEGRVPEQSGARLHHLPPGSHLWPRRRGHLRGSRGGCRPGGWRSANKWHPCSFLSPFVPGGPFSETRSLPWQRSPPREAPFSWNGVLGFGSRPL